MDIKTTFKLADNPPEMKKVEIRLAITKIARGKKMGLLMIQYLCFLLKNHLINKKIPIIWLGLIVKLETSKPKTSINIQKMNACRKKSTGIILNITTIRKAIKPKDSKECISLERKNTKLPVMAKITK
jgi:hypothetical protein